MSSRISSPRWIPKSQNLFHMARSLSRFLRGLAPQDGSQNVKIHTKWPGPSADFLIARLGSSWDALWLSGRLLGNILLICETPGRHFGCLGGSLETFWSSGRLLEDISAVLGDILPVWEAAGNHFGYILSGTQHTAHRTQHRAESREHRAQSTEHRAHGKEHRTQSAEQREQSNQPST